QAIAQSCNTALMGQRDRIGAEDLAAAAGALGLGGADSQDLGYPAWLGSVPQQAQGTDLAAAMIGQGDVLASPLSMATVAASIAAGKRVRPVLLPDYELPEQEEEPAALTETEATKLRQAMRAVVTEGTAHDLADIPGEEVLAKTGTAEGPEDETYGCLIAIQGDLAVAAFTAAGAAGGAPSAGPLAEKHLRSRSAGAAALLARPQHIGDSAGRRQPRIGVQPARLTGHPLDRPGDRDRGDHPPRGSAHRRRDRGHPGLALADALRPPAAAHPGQNRGGELRPVQAAVQPIRLLPGQQRLCRRAGEHGQCGAHGVGVPQSHRLLRGRHADALIALPAEQLRALPGVVAQSQQDRAGRCQQPVLTGGSGQLGQSGTEDETALHIAGDEPVELQGDRQAVRRRAGKMSSGNQLGERGRTRIQGYEHGRCFVQNADSARIVHRSILTSHTVRLQIGTETPRHERGCGYEEGDVRWPERWLKKYGGTMWSVQGPMEPPICSTSTCTSCTR